MATIAGEPPGRAGWPDFADYRPYPPAAVLAERLAATQALTTRLTRALDHARLSVPLVAIVNPPLWEIGHVAWFQEFWVHRQGDFSAPCRVQGGDRLYDSARVPHDARWWLPLPDPAATRRYLDETVARSIDRVLAGPPDDRLAYFVELAIAHQDMHNEAFAYMWQTLGYPLPLDAPPASPPPAMLPAGDVDIPAGTLELGARRGSGFVHDNEKWAHPVAVPAFAIARCATSNAEFGAFVEAGGYRQRDFWSDAGWAMRERLALDHPRYWRRVDGAWAVRRFDRIVPLAPAEPVVHVSAHEAEAYCRWAGRRLPTEAQWERAATHDTPGAPKRRYPWGDGPSSDGERRAHLDMASDTPAPVAAYPSGASVDGVLQLIGNVWEWTASRFAPFPGFSADPYREYSEPWFATDHRVLRGGSLATPARLIRSGWRNFYQPDRADMFCGFRTCAPGDGR